jgi:hypothetical protein
MTSNCTSNKTNVNFALYSRVGSKVNAVEGTYTMSTHISSLSHFFLDCTLLGKVIMNDISEENSRCVSHNVMVLES